MGRACLLLAVGFGLFTSRTIRADDSAAAKRVRPILVRCVACHNPDDESGDLDLTTREAALRGGETGPALRPGKPDESLFYKLVSKRKMPPKTPLSSDEMALVRDWIAGGAPWDGPITAAPAEAADSPRWAFRPVEHPAPPAVKDRDWVRTPVDAFLLAELEARGLGPRPPAERRIWIRRVTLDLIGLPPTPEEVEAFEKDERPDAEARLVDRLLASPHYGERWGRHWLDLARFGESHGFEYDRLRDHAWPYRDYVIKSLNEDKPYATFIKEQIAGDVMQPATPERIAATGFLVAGPWDQVGSGQANLVSRMRVREDELEDIVGVVSQTFLGVTVQCARCHNHKFDPIPQKDYYRIKAAFEGVGRADRSTLSEPERLAREIRRRVLVGAISASETELATIDRAARAKVAAARTAGVDAGRPEPRLLWTFESDASEDRGALPGTLRGPARVSRGRLILSDKGYLRSGPLPFELREKTLEAWVALADHAQRGGGVISVERGKGAPFDAIVFGEAQPGKWMAGSENFVRTQELAAPVESSKPGELVHIAIVYEPDGAIRIYRQGVLYGKSYRPEGTGSGLQIYDRAVSHLNFGLRHTGALNGFLSGEIEEARIYDRALKSAEVEASFRAGPVKIPEGELDAVSDEPARLRRGELIGRLAALRSELADVDKIPLVYSVAPFKPPATKILARGDVETPGDAVSAGGLSSIDRPSGELGLAVDAPEAQRRLRLADWVADPANPLAARVMVNRIWHYHFGTGLVATPSDFGANGGRPSHPALLDWLASDFLKGGGRLKSLHRTIVLSAAYRQASTIEPKASAIDAACRLLWRFPPRRLEGEAVLDSMLATTGRLNPAIGGPSFRPFTVTVFNSNFYHLTDPDDLEYRRRTVYRMDVHSAKSPLMDGLDCPDPSTKTPKRSLTVTPLQALALMNDSFVERQARRLADRARADAGDDTGRQVERAYRLALGRPPGGDEAKAALGLVKDHGLHRLTWALLNANEFLYLR